MTVEQLGKNTSSYEITEWMSYYKIKAKNQEREAKRAEARQEAQEPGTPRTMGPK